MTQDGVYVVGFFALGELHVHIGPTWPTIYQNLNPI